MKKPTKKVHAKNNKIDTTKEAPVLPTPPLIITPPVPATSTSSSAAGSSAPVTSTSPVVSAPPAPAIAASPVVLSTTPPVVNIPATPPGFVPQPLTSFRGFYAKAAQVAAVPDAVLELNGSTAYASTFGPAAPPALQLASALSNAAGWTAIRVALENYLLYAKSQEGVSWKGAIVQLDQAKAIYDVTIAQNPQVPVLFPALTRLLDANATSAKKAAATRKRTKAASVASTGAAATARTGATAPVTTGATAAPAAPTGGTGGAAK